MQFRTLGPLEVVEQGEALPLGGGKQLALFALLLLHANEVVSNDRLVDELWGEHPPATAGKIVRNYVSLLRKHLGDRLVRRPPGYLLRIEPGELDSDRFENLIREAREQPPAAARETLRRALELWNGPPLAQVAYEAFAQQAIASLEELHLQALEDRIDVDLQLGHEREVVPELERLVREQPLRERPRSLLMLALYRVGRQADALDAYQDARRALVDELGLEPSPALQALQRRILAHDETLAGPRSERRARRRRRGGLMIVAGGAVLLAAGIAAGVVALTSSTAARLTSIAPNSVGVIDPKTNRLVAEIPIGSAPSATTFGNGALWTANTGDSTVTRIDAKTRSVVKTIAVPGPPSGIAVAGSNAWVLLLYQRNPTADPVAGDAGLARIDTSSNDVLGSFRLSAGFSNTFDDSLAAEGADLWAVDVGVVSRVDPVRETIVARVLRENGSSARIAAGFGAVWVLGWNSVKRIDPASNTIVASIPISGGPGPGPDALAVGEDAVWVANRAAPATGSVNGVSPRALQGTVSRIDPRTNAVVATIDVGGPSSVVAAGAGAVWVANRDGRTISRIDTATNRIVATIKVGGRPQSIAVGGGAVWFTVG